MKRFKIKPLYIIYTALLIVGIVSTWRVFINIEKNHKKESDSPRIQLPANDTVFHKKTNVYYKSKDQEQSPMHREYDFFNYEDKKYDESLRQIQELKKGFYALDGDEKIEKPAIKSSPIPVKPSSHLKKKTIEKPVVSNKPKKLTKEEKRKVLEKKYNPYNNKSYANNRLKTTNIGVKGTQIIQSGQGIRLELLEELTIEGVTLPKYTSFTGVVSFTQYRVNVKIKSIAFKDQIIKANFEVFGQDGLEGIPINTDKALSKAKDESMTEIIDQIPSKIPLGNTVGRLISGKNREVKVEITDGTNLYIVNK